MTDLTEKWKAGKIDALYELINKIATVDDSRSLSDEYLKEKGLMTRDECGVALEYPYGIVMVISDYVLPYLKKLHAIKEKNEMFESALEVCLENAELIKCLGKDNRHILEAAEYIKKQIKEVIKC